jgi:DNA-binding NarL/FixJ family response regulator
MAIRIVVAEDGPLIREGMRLLLATQGDVTLVAGVGALDELCAAVAEHTPDAVVTDIRLPPVRHNEGRGDEGIRAAELFARDHPDLGVVVLSQHLEPGWALRLFEPGARGRAYLQKERAGDLRTVRDALERVIAGGAVLDPWVVDRMLRGGTHRADSPLSLLTPRETRVLEAMACGADTPDIAVSLTMSEHAVEQHIRSLLDTLGLDLADADPPHRVRALLRHLAEAEGG